MWSEDLRALGDTVTAPTLYELGDSMEAWGRAVLDLAPPGPLVVVGNSVGGSCALEVARLAPDRVHALVLVGAKAGVRPEPEFRDDAVRFLEREGIDAAWERYWAPIFAPDAAPAVVERGRTIADAQGVEAIARGVRVFHDRPDRAEDLATFRGRVVIVRGEHDRIPKEPEALAASLPDGSFVEVEGAGHFVPIEAPDALSRIVSQTVE